MAFDFKGFEKQKFEDRLGTVDLGKFGESEEPITWHIRGLNAEDLARVEDEGAMVKTIGSLIDTAAAAVGGDKRARQDIVKESLGIGEKTPATLVREYSIFQAGSIEPNKPGNRQAVVKFARAYPVEFKTIVREILTLTGKGAIAKKKPAQCGQERK